MHILEVMKSTAKAKAAKIAKQYEVNKAFDGLEDAKQFDHEQKRAILEIADTKGFKVILDYEEGIIKKCESILSMQGLPDKELKEVQIEYSIAKAKYSFLNNLQDTTK